jgi:hypothetical protein
MNFSHILNGPAESLIRTRRKDTKRKDNTPLKLAMQELDAAEASVQGARIAYVEAIRRKADFLRSLVDRFGYGPFIDPRGEMFTIVARKSPGGVTYFTRSVRS